MCRLSNTSVIVVLPVLLLGCARESNFKRSEDLSRDKHNQQKTVNATSGTHLQKIKGELDGWEDLAREKDDEQKRVHAKPDPDLQEIKDEVRKIGSGGMSSMPSDEFNRIKDIIDRDSSGKTAGTGKPDDGTQSRGTGDVGAAPEKKRWQPPEKKR